MTIRPFSAPQAAPATSTPATPAAADHAVPTTIAEARQLLMTNTAPTDRSIPAVMTAQVCAIATRASRTPLLAAVCTTLALKPAGWFDA